MMKFLTFVTFLITLLIFSGIAYKYQEFMQDCLSHGNARYVCEMMAGGTTPVVISR